jgi:hypothetical protein
VQSGNARSTSRGNQANQNGGNGIYLLAGAIENTFLDNSMHDKRRTTGLE